MVLPEEKAKSILSANKLIEALMTLLLGVFKSDVNEHLRKILD
jgi:hypothetical protein